MKKRIEKVVEWTKSSGERLTHLKKYNVHLESENYYNVMDDLGVVTSWIKEDFKVVSEREVLEFEGEKVANFSDIFDVRVFSEIDLTNYDLKLIATPKDKTYEDMSKEELIKLLKSKE